GNEQPGLIPTAMHEAIGTRLTVHDFKLKDRIRGINRGRLVIGLPSRNCGSEQQRSNEQDGGWSIHSPFSSALLLTLSNGIKRGNLDSWILDKVQRMRV